MYLYSITHIYTSYALKCVIHGVNTHITKKKNIPILTHRYINIICTYTPKRVTHGIYTHISISVARLLGWRSRN